LPVFVYYLRVSAYTQILLADEMENETALFKVFSDPTRLRLAVLLALEGETCVCKLAEALDAPESRISRHLGVMRMNGMVESRREGTWMHYKLSPARSELENYLQQCFRDCLADHPSVRADLARLSAASCSS
jgi:ArsR family transcriptional regulator